MGRSFLGVIQAVAYFFKEIKTTVGSNSDKRERNEYLSLSNHCGLFLYFLSSLHYDPLPLVT
jgi:hypothetical protein